MKRRACSFSETLGVISEAFRGLRSQVGGRSHGGCIAFEMAWRQNISCAETGSLFPQEIRSSCSSIRWRLIRIVLVAVRRHFGSRFRLQRGTNELLASASRRKAIREVQADRSIDSMQSTRIRDRERRHNSPIRSCDQRCRVFRANPAVSAGVGQRLRDVG